MDQDIVKEAAALLGTTSLKDTINMALREVLHARKRMELIALLGDQQRFDFRVAEHAWGGEE
ncbi:MAG: type II toxin-antitoxin system VapB family antitoxin [Chloroflexota bacterium]